MARTRWLVPKWDRLATIPCPMTVFALLFGEDGPHRPLMESVFASFFHGPAPEAPRAGTVALSTIVRASYDFSGGKDLPAKLLPEVLFEWSPVLPKLGIPEASLRHFAVGQVDGVPGDILLLLAGKTVLPDLTIDYEGRSWIVNAVYPFPGFGAVLGPRPRIQGLDLIPAELIDLGA